jgi:hypothetical protein
MRNLKLVKRGRFQEVLQDLSTELEQKPILPNAFAATLQSRLDPATCDRLFDSILPLRYRTLSVFHWTPINVIYKILEVLGDSPIAKFIDIGSGVGKVCIALSYLTDWEIFGLEQRVGLHDIASSVVRENEIKRVHLINGNAIELNWNDYDIFYLFNPFEENSIPESPILIDSEIDLNPILFTVYVDFVKSQLRQLSVGKKLITYHGFGDQVPEGWKVIFDTEVGAGSLTIWEKE